MHSENLSEGGGEKGEEEKEGEGRKERRDGWKKEEEGLKGRKQEGKRKKTNQRFDHMSLMSLGLSRVPDIQWYSVEFAE